MIEHKGMRGVSNIFFPFLLLGRIQNVKIDDYSSNICCKLSGASAFKAKLVPL